MGIKTYLADAVRSIPSIWEATVNIFDLTLKSIGALLMAYGAMLFLFNPIASGKIFEVYAAMFGFAIFWNPGGVEMNCFRAMLGLCVVLYVYVLVAMPWMITEETSMHGTVKN